MQQSRDLPEAPVAIYGTHNSQRIVSQRGVFVIFGADTKPLEEQYQNSTGRDKNGKMASFPDQLLLKIAISRDHIDDLKKSLDQIGVSDSVIYPDLEGLAKETKRIFGF